ncbi:hypothetical protein ACFQ48_06365 [Hymenobacter caeli]|uniref:Pentapeptide MXKDX repeat protein n=1 Tax=Hymenobacter caeli TaxID=2735894 RepID=A0ABX2FQN4_9BACT|nr:hypothetical protein [Hymenobacter caeli]NRT18804.1 hypothetical protein [Hymenobacter caeli]
MKTTLKLVAALALTASFFSASAQGDDKMAKKDAKMTKKSEKAMAKKDGKMMKKDKMKDGGTMTPAAAPKM